MNRSWSAHELDLVDAADELDIAVEDPDGSLRRWTTIWVVRAGDEVYVRTWYRRDTGWYGAALRSRRARIRVPQLEAVVTVEDLGDGDTELRDRVDAAYRAKYGSSGSASMVGGEATETTLRLSLAPEPIPHR